MRRPDPSVVFVVRDPETPPSFMWNEVSAEPDSLLDFIDDLVRDRLAYGTPPSRGVDWDVPESEAERIAFFESLGDWLWSLLHTPDQLEPLLSARERPLRVVIAEASTYTLPWEYLRAPGGYFIALKPRVSFVRVALGCRDPEGARAETLPRASTRELSILPVAVSPRTESGESSPDMFHDLIDAIPVPTPAKRSPIFRPDPKTGARACDPLTIDQALKSQPSSILHVFAHGSQGEVILSDKLGKRVGYPPSAWTPVLSAASRTRGSALRLAVFCSCRLATPTAGRDRIFAFARDVATGSHLECLVAPLVTLNAAAIPAFSSALYHGLLSGEPVEEAVAGGNIILSLRAWRTR